MKNTLKVLLCAVMVGLLAGPQYTSNCFGAASGNYTDLLPIGAAGDTTVISRGSGWAVTTLPPTQTFGDSLSRLEDTVYQSTATGNIQSTLNVTTFTALGSQVGSTTFPATWVASGRSMRVTVKGKYSTTGSPTWNWGLSIGTNSVLTTGALTAPTSVGDKPFSAQWLLTVATTGASGTANASLDLWITTAAATGSNTINVVSFSTVTNTASAVDWTNQLVVNPTLTWGTGTSTITATNVIVEFLN